MILDKINTAYLGTWSNDEIDVDFSVWEGGNQEDVKMQIGDCVTYVGISSSKNPSSLILHNTDYFRCNKITFLNANTICIGNHKLKRKVE